MRLTSPSSSLLPPSVQSKLRSQKMDALTAMNGSEYGSGVDNNAPTPSQHPSHKSLGPLTTTFEPLPLFGEGSNSSNDVDTNFVPTHHNTPRYPPARQRKRLFELEEAPTFYPSIEEFSDPLKYIKWVGEPEGGNGKSYGIVKIVPPVGWNPPFVLDQERFRFRTRVQRLNSLSADARASLNYLEQLQKFHAQQGHARVSIPIVDRKPVDLYQLKLVVTSYGGYDSVARNRKWAEVTRKVGYEEKDSGHLAGQIKAAYSRIIYPFERFLELNKENSTKKVSNEDVAPSSPNAQAVNDDSINAGEDTPMVENDTTSSGVSTRRRSSRRKTDPTDTPVILSQKRRLRQQQPTPPPAGTSGDFYLAPGAEEQMCEICLRGDDGMSMLLCDECNRGYHMYCLDPPLTSIPKSEWYCPPCLVGTGNDYGFDDGETHSLSSFWKRAEAFRSDWWLKHASEESIWTDPNGQPNGLTRPVPGTDLHVSEDDIEREFWRLVHSPDETVEVEYGADVHSTTHGSALPTLETCPLSPYSRDGWNLNNLPILNGSLLRYIKSDISGMTVPWVYVGMMFSTFCWHNEDHYTYSINYQHFGDTKTWYGVPGSDAYRLEDALRKAAPDLFEQSPDLLFQLVTMMSPDKLQKEGVNVYAVDQRANEFVITYPKAYHSGFNQGFNLNEAVNFALPDWIDLDLECAKRYQKFNRFPVFSHDELVVTVFQHNQSVETAIWLQSAMREMVEREIDMREKVRTEFPGIQEVVEDADQAESEYQCIHCNVFCYLGQIYSRKSEGVACLEHGNQVCGMDATTKWTLRLRYSDEELQSMLERTIERAAVPANWQAKLHKLITNHARPPLRSLRGLLHEGEKISTSLEELNNLKEFVEKANKWIDEATPLIARRHQRRVGVGNSTKDSVNGRRSKRMVKTKNEEDEVMGTTNDEENGGSLANSDDVFRMVKEVERLPFDAPEIQAIQLISQQVSDFITDAKSLLKRLSLQDESVDEEIRLKERKEILASCEELVMSGLTLNVQLPYMEDLRRLVGRDKWTREAETLTNTFTDLDEVEAFISEGLSFGIKEDESLMENLCDRRDKGLLWKEKAEEMLRPVTKDTKWPCHHGLSDLEKAVSAPASVAIVPELMVKLQQLLKQVKDVSKSSVSVITTMEERKKEVLEAEKVGQFLRIDPITTAFEEAGRLVTLNSTVNVVADQEDELKQVVQDYAPMDKFVGKWLLYTRGKERNTSDLAGKLAVLKEDERRLVQIGISRRSPPVTCICRSEKENSEQGKTVECTECRCTYHTDCLRANPKNLAAWTCPFCDPERLHTFVRRHESLPALSTLLDQVKLPQTMQRLTFGEMETYKLVVSIRQKAQLFEQTAENTDFQRPKDERDLEQYVDMLKDALSIEWSNIRLNKERISVALYCAQVIYAYKGKDPNGSLIVSKVGPNDPRYSHLSIAPTESKSFTIMDLTKSSSSPIPNHQNIDFMSPDRRPVDLHYDEQSRTLHPRQIEQRSYSGYQGQLQASVHSSSSQSYRSGQQAPFQSSPHMHHEDPRSYYQHPNYVNEAAQRRDLPAIQASSGSEDAQQMHYRTQKAFYSRHSPTPPTSLNYQRSDSQRAYLPSMGFGRPPPASNGPPMPYDMNIDMGRSYAQPQSEASPQANNSGDESYGGVGKDKKRKRGKRARFVFEEEVGIFVPVNGERIFCLCRQGETGNMISCDRCALWFHTNCVHVNSVADLGGERWICPMCCVKTERRYPFAEVKVKEMNVTDPNLWLDVRATLRSTKAPFSKLQHWTVDEDRRIVLHLESFLPATLPSKSDRGEDTKRQRSDEGDGPSGHRRSGSQGSTGSNSAMANALGSVSKMPSWNDVRARVTPIHRTPNAEENAARARREAEERHRQGMANLYSRGVSDSMIQKWFIGWNGKELVYPRYDRMGVYHELALGPRVSLAQDDHDGSKFMQVMLDREAEERRMRGETPIIAAPSSSTGPAPPPPRPAQLRQPESNLPQPDALVKSFGSASMTNPERLHSGISQKPTGPVPIKAISSPINATSNKLGSVKPNSSTGEKTESESSTPSKPELKKSIYSVGIIPPFRGPKSSNTSEASPTPPEKEAKPGKEIKSIPSGIRMDTNVKMDAPPPLPQVDRPRPSNPSLHSGIKRDAQGIPITKHVNRSSPGPASTNHFNTARNVVERNPIKGNAGFDTYARSHVGSTQRSSNDLGSPPQPRVPYMQRANQPEERILHVRAPSSSPHSAHQALPPPRSQYAVGHMHGMESNRASYRDLPPPPPPSSLISNRRTGGEEMGMRDSSFSVALPPQNPRRSNSSSFPSPSLPPISPRFEARGPSGHPSRSSFTSSPQHQNRSPPPREYHHHSPQQGFYQSQRDYPAAGNRTRRLSPPPSARHSLGLQQYHDQQKPSSIMNRSSISPRLSNGTPSNVVGEKQSSFENRESTFQNYHSSSSSTSSPKEQQSLTDMRQLARRMKPNATEEEIEEMVRHALT